MKCTYTYFFILQCLREVVVVVNDGQLLPKHAYLIIIQITTVVQQ